MHELPDYNKITFPEADPVPFEEVVPDASKEALDLLKKFLVYQSKQRISAKEVHLDIFIQSIFNSNNMCHRTGKFSEYLLVLQDK